MGRSERVVLVAAGVVTPIGEGVAAFWLSLVTGASGISPIERFPVSDLRVGRGGEIKKISRIAHWGHVPDCRATQLLVAAADELCGEAGSRPLPAHPDRVAVVLGTALGGVEEGERALAGARQPRRLRGALYDSPTHNLARWLGARGPAMTVSTACASGTSAIGIGAELLRQGVADAVVAGGYDVLCRFVMRGFDGLRALTREEIRPFDRRRSGLLLGEAAALVLMRREGDAGSRRLGTLLGHGSAIDGCHIAAPDPDGRGLERSIRAAMSDAGVEPQDVDFVSAHGTGTPLNDRVETAVLRRTLGPRAHQIPVNSIKPAMGHTMGAGAVLEGIMCLLASHHGQIPPTLNLEEPDPECDLDYVPGRARAARPAISLSTSLGFGGCNATLVLEGGTG